MADDSAHWRTPRFSPIAHSLLLLGAIAGVFLCGVWDDGCIAAFLMMAGLALVVCPPRIRVDGKVWAAASALLLAASLALLPQDWFGAPEWRRQLAAAGVPFPASISVTPRETYFWLALLALAMSTALFALAHPVRSRTQLALALGAVLVCGLYAGLAIYARQTGAEFPFSPDPTKFGFFRNHNHAATFLVTGSVIALGILAVAFRHRHWFAGALAAICLGVCVTGLFFFSVSRGGIVALLAGTVLWLAGLGGAHRTKPLLVSFAAVLLGGMLLLFSAPGIVRDRLVKLSGSVKERIVSTSPEAAPLDGRIPIFQDTLPLIRDYPITGVGLGNFRHVFPMYRERVYWEAPVAHPESDWLMLAAEAGLPALLVSLVGIGLLLRSIWPLRTHPYWPLRWAILCAAFSALLHGLVDVPAHRVALGWWMLVLAGFGFQAIPREPARPSRLQHAVFILAGLGAVALSVFLFRAQWFGGPPSPRRAAYEAQVEIIGLRVDGKMEESLEAAHRAIAAYPLADFLHFQRGITLLRLSRAGEADAAFRAQRMMNFIPPSVPAEQGKIWLKTDPERTGALWAEALERQARIARGGPTKPHALPDLFRDLLRLAAPVPALERRLLDAARGNPELTLLWLETASQPSVEAELAGRADFTAAFSERERLRFLETWYRRGDRERLFTWLAAQPDWRKTARPFTLRRLVEAKDFSAAVQTAAGQFAFQLDLPEPGGGARDAPAIAPENPSAAFEHYWRIGNVVTARRILEDARADPSGSDAEIWRLSAALSARESRWEEAWIQVERYLRATQPESFP